MNPYSPAFVPSHSRQSSMVFPQSNTTTTNSSPTDEHVGSSIAMHAMNPNPQVLPRLHQRAHSLAVQSHPSLIPQIPYKPRPVEVISPLCRRTPSSLLHHLKKLDMRDSLESSQAIAAYKQSADMVTQPSEMPIGSLVHLKKPPKWGVVKISNIPYSITKQEIHQFLGRQASLIKSDKGCPIHIIMERSTAKTMDCYAEFQTPTDAKETVIRINRIYETGRAPRLGNRHVDVELTDQDALLKDLFPRTKCVAWKNGMPYIMPNNDRFCTGFAGFFTSEEIILAIRHAEIPHRSPFCDKCPQRTYESTISTLHKFPWYATELYTVHDRNRLFDLTNRHIQALVSRIKRVNTVGLDLKLLHDLLQAGLKCPAFNERMKYTFCFHSEIESEITKFSEMGKWFPFDTLVRMPNFHEDILMYFANLISQGTEPKNENLGLRNMYPVDHPTLRSPYGPIWYEWPQSVSDSTTWKVASNHELFLLTNYLFTGWCNEDMNNVFNLRRVSGESSFSVAPVPHQHISLSLSETERNQALTESSSPVDMYANPSRRASESASIGGGSNLNQNGSPWGQRLLLNPPGRVRPRYVRHRITQSSPMCLPSPTTNPWAQERYE
ncbi:hypothetical protein BJX99DRAFT_266167 [Aspergillus californicus]